MRITEADVPLITATLRHELMPSDATKQALDLAIKEHASFPAAGEQDVGRGRGEHAIPADGLAPKAT